MSRVRTGNYVKPEVTEIELVETESVLDNSHVFTPKKEICLQGVSGLKVDITYENEHKQLVYHTIVKGEILKFPFSELLYKKAQILEQKGLIQILNS